MDIYVDASTLIALGTVGELELLLNFDGDVVVELEVYHEITTEPAATNLHSLLKHEGARRSRDGVRAEHSKAKEILDEEEINGGVALIAQVLRWREHDQSIAIVSDDRRVRTVAEGLGATVTGTVGVVVRAVHEGLPPSEAKDLIRRIDSHGLHMTGELRETAYRLIDEAAKE
ncbi:hypothetical protein GJR96_01950 [Haloferax sp. MBLA0076]|uniref:DUF3368 domain-containing protein n=1 Tax=Haloferax litoreum TaxID=2666140 RepID=A0A6A8GDA5_9EURY|nr:MULTISPECIES: hypothetical protein [Haloferax]KAB1192269.1 hypothetical protein Hfx1148_01940 [Haloferax sp. CBA1148]MRX20726.1 hypothetical protein [Haloferax litoreum]